jgi:deazaflavin-dependent oxidoreductase (nitroreductase family)
MTDLPRPKPRSAWRRRTMNRLYDAMSGVMRDHPAAGDAALTAMYKSHLAVYRLSGGRLWNQMSDGLIMLLTTTGRRSGEPRTGPLLVLPWEDGFAVCGSRGGTSKTPGWVHNLRADPHATLTVRRRTIAVLATEVTDEARYAAAFTALTAAHNGYALYAAKSTRTLPIFHLKRDDQGGGP